MAGPWNTVVNTTYAINDIGYPYIVTMAQSTGGAFGPVQPISVVFATDSSASTLKVTFTNNTNHPHNCTALIYMEIPSTATNITTITFSGTNLLYYYHGSSIPTIDVSNAYDPMAGTYTAITTSSLSINMTSGNYFGLMYSSNSGAAGNVEISNIPTSTYVCLSGSTNIILFDRTIKLLKDCQRGDEILEDANTNKTNKVANIVKSKFYGLGYKIRKGLIGNTEDIICTDHPFYCNNNNNRIFPSNIKGVEEYYINEDIYDIQYEDEGTFYANNCKVDSLPPNNRHFKLSKELYYDTSKYTNYVLSSEDEKIRNKPLMISSCDNFVLYEN